MENDKTYLVFVDRFRNTILRIAADIHKISRLLEDIREQIKNLEVYVNGLAKAKRKDKEA